MKKTSITISFILLTLLGYTQEVKITGDPVPPSPNAASLGIFGAIPVGHYTGTPNIDIPIYEIDLDGKKIPISISYHASGIRVAQEASWVGLGWALNAGGMISRQVQDDIDFVPELRKGSAQGYFFAKNLPYYLSLNDDYSKIGNKFSDFVNDMKICDTEPDLYTYNFGNYSGVMMTGQDPLLGTNVSSVSAKAILRSPKELLSIEYNFSKDGSWVAYDGEGYAYYFKTEELSKPYSSNNTGPGSLIDGFIPSKALDRPTRLLTGFSGPIKSITSSWMLDSIKSPKNNVISFHYDFDNIETTVTAMESLHQIIGSTGWPHPYDSYYIPGKSYNYSYSQIKQARLTSIKFNGGEILFNSTDRLDLYSLSNKKAQKLSEIIVKNNKQNIIRNIKFSYSYSGDTSSYYTCRLKLDELEVDNLKYLFKYNEGELPPKHSLRTDHWGYFNNSTDPKDTRDNLCICPNTILDYGERRLFFEGRNRASNKEYMQHAMLKSITYPTGSQTFLEYETHKFGEGNSSENEVTVIREFGRVASLNYMIESLEDLYDEENPNNVGRNDELLYSQDFEYDGIDPMNLNVRVYSNLEKESFNHISPNIGLTIWLEKKKNDNTYEILRPYKDKTIPITMVYEDNKGLLLSNDYILDRVLVPGTYRVVLKKEVWIPNRSAVDFAQTQIELHTGYYREEEGASNEDSYMGGGLRIKQVSNYIDNKKEIINYSYDGVLLMTKPLYKRVISDPTYYWLEVSSQSFTPFSYSAQGAPVGYSTVKEIYGTKENNNGYIEYNFYNEEDDISYVKDRYVSRYPVYPSLRNGQISSVFHYNSFGDLKKHTKYKYILKEQVKIGGLLKAIFVANGKYEEDAFPRGEAFVKSYYQHCETWRLDSEITNLYESSGSIETNIKYYYDPTYHIKNKIETKTSNGSVTSTLYKYSFDNTDIISKKMQSNHMMEIPLEQILIKNNSLISANKVEYIDTLRMLVPQKYYTLKSNLSLNLNNYSEQYELEARYSKYLSKGNIGSVFKRDNLPITYIWGYNFQYPIAEIKGATYDQVKTALGVPPESLSSAIEPNTNLINSLRAKLPNALVTTYTYKPLIGMTSATDPRGAITYYDYDTSGRLKETYIIENGVKKIIQVNDYHYQNQ